METKKQQARKASCSVRVQTDDCSGTNKFPGCSADHGQIEDHAHAQRHARRGCYGKKWRQRMPCTACWSKKTIAWHRMSEVALTIAEGLPAAFKLGENHFPYVLPTRVNLIIGTYMQLFCMAMAWSSHTGLRPVVMS